MFDKASYNGTLLFALILTINRFMVFLFPKTNERIFGQPEIYYTIAMGWSILIVFMVGLTLGGSYNLFDTDKFRLLLIKDELRPWYAIHIMEPVSGGEVEESES